MDVFGKGIGPGVSGSENPLKPASLVVLKLVLWKVKVSPAFTQWGEKRAKTIEKVNNIRYLNEFIFVYISFIGFSY